MHAHPQVVYWSQDKAEARAKVREYFDQGRTAEIIEQDWNPRAFSIRRTFHPDGDAMQRVLTGGRA
jgi:hypothetical protein